MANKIMVAALGLLMAGCTAWRYPNWEYVRVENKVPPSRLYKMQESCNQSPADCPKWFKLRATTYGANTVVMQADNEESSGSGVNVNVNTNIGRRQPNRAPLSANTIIATG